MGGGTGTFTVLSGLKKYDCNLTAIVAMADDGGSTGMLRDELGVLPPGDVRQCLVALSTSDIIMRQLMNYRFTSGKLRGHNFGNLLLSALEKVTGNFDKAVEAAGEILRIEGHVVPATLEKATLVARLTGKVVRGQNAIHNTNIHKKLRSITLSPSVEANPKALFAIKKADAIIIGPGDFYSSLVPNFLVRGIPESVRNSRARKIFICNLMSRKNHTNDFSVTDYTREIEKYIQSPVDTVLYNNVRPPNTLIRRYAREGEALTKFENLPHGKHAIGGDFINETIPKIKSGDPLSRSLIRHNSAKLASVIARLIGIPTTKRT